MQPRILIIEDNDLVREQIVLTLTLNGYSASEAKNGRDGIELARNAKPDLILCDIEMPGLDGYEVLAELRRAPATANIPFIFLTGRGSRGQIRQGMNLGADDYISKPFEVDEILDAVRSRLEKRASTVLTRQDALTGLPDQAALEEMLPSMLRLEATQGKPLGLILVALDHFDRIQDALGRESGESVIRTIAERLQELRSEPKVIFRKAPDQFVVVLPHLARPQDAAEVAKEILFIVQRPLQCQGRELHLTASLGVSLHPLDTKDAERLIGYASMASRKAQEQGRNAYCLHQPGQENLLLDRLELEAELRQAIAGRNLALHYQPQIDLKTGALIGVEALARWQHPRKGMIPPGKFIPIAEEGGFVAHLGDWALREVCYQFQAWKVHGVSIPSIAVNISARQLQSQDIAKLLERIISEASMNPQNLEIELTESAIIKNPHAIIVMLNRLRSLGVTISIDDFGTGYSSLAYLKNLPLDVIKIDQSFVRDVSNNPQGAALVEAILSMARSLGKKTIAEGVETKAEMDWLREHGCDGMQGYYFSKPLPPQELERLLRGGLA